MLAEICVQHAFNYHLAHLSLSLNGNVLKEIHVLILKHDLKCSSYVMMFEDHNIRVADGQGVLGPNHKLVRVPRVFIIVEEIC